MKKTVTINHQFTTLNKYVNSERANRFLGAKIKKEETAIAEKAFEGVVINTPTKVTYTWYVPHRRFDLDNIGFACKFIHDGAVKAGALENDNINHIYEIRHQYVIDKENTKVVIEFEEV